MKGINGILFDHGRASRVGMPEAVFCEGKSLEALITLFERIDKTDVPLLFTRLAPQMFEALPAHVRQAVSYHPLSRIAFRGSLPTVPVGSVAIVSAGTADACTTWEAAKTLEYLGVAHTVFEDNGVAGLWRLVDNLNDVNSHSVVIVIAGLDAALASVLGGLTPKPVIAVPTSTGYGISRNGETALSSMLVSCAPGVSVMNIDNGYGAACAALRVINLLQ